MLLELYESYKAVNANTINFQTPSPFDHLEQDYVYTSIGIPFCRNLPYNSWYVRQYTYPERAEIFGSCWEEYLQDQVYFLIYNNPGINKFTISRIIDQLKHWGVNKEVFLNKDLAEHISELYDTYPSDWKPKDKARHWYSQAVEYLPRLENEASNEYTKRKMALKAKLRSTEQDFANEETIKTISLDYQTQKHGLMPTIDILESLSQKSKFLIRKLGTEDEDWQRKGAFTEQCISIALSINPDLTRKELVNIIASELPSGKISVRGVQKAIGRMKES